MKRKAIVNRREQLFNIISSVEKLDTEAAADMFNVSKETIRQDFLYLEERGIIEKVHGGAILSNSNSVEDLLIRENENFLSKDKIVKKALEYVPKGECIVGLDTGSTAALLASYLSKRSDLFIVSNSYRVMQSLANTNNRLLLLGGDYNKAEMAYYGEEIPHVLENITLDIYFVGTSGVKERNGIQSRRFQESLIKKQILARSSKKIVLADSGKFQRTSLVEVAPWSMVDILITDDGIPKDIKEKLESSVQVVIAD